MRTVWFHERFQSKMLVYPLPPPSWLLSTVALDIKGAFDSVWWKGFLAHLWNIGFCDKAFRSHLSNRYIQVVTPLDSTDLCCLTTGVPQGANWSPPLFNLYIYIRQLPTV